MPPERRWPLQRRMHGWHGHGRTPARAHTTERTPPISAQRLSYHHQGLIGLADSLLQSRPICRIVCGRIVFTIVCRCGRIVVDRETPWLRADVTRGRERSGCRPRQARGDRQAPPLQRKDEGARVLGRGLPSASLDAGAGHLQPAAARARENPEGTKDAKNAAARKAVLDATTRARSPPPPFPFHLHAGGLCMLELFPHSLRSTHSAPRARSALAKWRRTCNPSSQRSPRRPSKLYSFNAGTTRMQQ